MKALIQKLVETDGPSGYETNLRSLIRSQVEPLADQVWVDNLGILFARKGQVTEQRPEGASLKIMLAAHMDEIGLMVKTITKEGFLQFSKMGGIDDRILPAQKVNVYTDKNAYPGIIGSKPPHIQKEEERKKREEIAMRENAASAASLYRQNAKDMSPEGLAMTEGYVAGQDESIYQGMIKPESDKEFKKTALGSFSA